MNIYNYNPSNGSFINESAADESPLEPGVFLVPANATTIAPPIAPEGQIAVYSANQWRLFPDLRGTTYWLPPSPIPHVMEGIGELPVGAVTVAPPASAPNQQIGYANGAWTTTPDFIGAVYWTADGTQHTVTSLGSMPSEAIVVPPPSVPAGFSLGYIDSKWVLTPDAYNTQRAAAYPQIADQLDMLWHAINQGVPFDKTCAFYTAIAAVKAQFPKPDGSTI